MLRDWFIGDDEPLPDEMSESELAEIVALEREADALGLEAEDWRASQDEDEELSDVG
jgi:hypothetical protein